jgi:hypothetical protein
VEKSWFPDVEQVALIDLGEAGTGKGYGWDLMKATPYAFECRPLEDHTVFEQSF